MYRPPDRRNISFEGREREIVVLCDHCEHRQDFTIYPSVSADLRPDLKQQLITGNLLSYSCDACGCECEVTYPLLYHDTARRFMVYLSQDGSPPKKSNETLTAAAGLPFWSSYQMRLVGNRNDLIEAICILDAGFDDRVVQFLKDYVRDRIGEAGYPAKGDLYFDDLGEANAPDHPDEARKYLVYLLLTDFGPLRFPVEREIYDVVAETLTSEHPSIRELAGQWLRIDEYYVRPGARSVAPEVTGISQRISRRLRRLIQKAMAEMIDRARQPHEDMPVLMLTRHPYPPPFNKGREHERRMRKTSYRCGNLDEALARSEEDLRSKAHLQDTDAYAICYLNWEPESEDGNARILCYAEEAGMESAGEFVQHGSVRTRNGCIYFRRERDLEFVALTGKRILQGPNRGE